MVAVDANCKGYGERRKEVEDAVGDWKDWTVCAVPDPHVERWLLVDSAAFKEALGRGCAAPDLKCDRDRYKQLLLSAVREAGQSPLVGGMEHADTIVQLMDLDRASKTDASLQKLIDELRRHFKEWQR